MRVNLFLYKLHFLSSYFSFQPNKIFFHPFTYPSFKPNTYERKLNFFYPLTFLSLQLNRPLKFIIAQGLHFPLPCVLFDSYGLIIIQRLQIYNNNVHQHFPFLCFCPLSCNLSLSLKKNIPVTIGLKEKKLKQWPSRSM